MSDEKPSLYERLGGEETITKLVDAFYERVFADDELRPFFANTSKDKLRRMQREFFSAAMDGPIKYAGRSLREAHGGLGITNRHLGRFIEHLTDTLGENQIDDQDAYDIISRINKYAEEITGDGGTTE